MNNRPDLAAIRARAATALTSCFYVSTGSHALVGNFVQCQEHHGMPSRCDALWTEPTELTGLCDYAERLEEELAGYHAIGNAEGAAWAGIESAPPCDCDTCAAVRARRGEGKT